MIIKRKRNLVVFICLFIFICLGAILLILFANEEKYKFDKGTILLDVEQALNDKNAIYNGSIINDEDCAFMYAVYIMENTLDKNIKKYSSRSVSFDEKERLWYVYFGLGSGVVGGDITIVFSEKTGEVKVIHFGE